MDSAVGSSVSASAGSIVRDQTKVSLFRLYTLRLAYLILALGLGVYVWPSVINHTNEFATASGVRFALLGGVGATAVLGLKYPLKMLPLLLFELTWKAIYLIAFAAPLWVSHQMNEAVAEDAIQVMFVVIFLPLIPWRYVFANFVFARGDRWK